MSIQLLFAIHWQVWLIPPLTPPLGWMWASKASRSWVPVRESIVGRVWAPLCCYWWGCTHSWETRINVGTLSRGHVCSLWSLSWRMPTILDSLFLLSLSLYCRSFLERVGMFLRALKAHLFEEGHSDGVRADLQTQGWICTCHRVRRKYFLGKEKWPRRHVKTIW